MKKNVNSSLFVWMQNTENKKTASGFVFKETNTYWYLWERDEEKKYKKSEWEITGMKK